MNSTQICTSHECEKCGKKLRTKLSKGEKIFMLGLLTTYIGIMAFMIFVLPTPLSSDCYTKEFLSGQGTNLETNRITDIKCP